MAVKFYLKISAVHSTAAPVVSTAWFGPSILFDPFVYFQPDS